MPRCYLLNTSDQSGPQSAEDSSFNGGCPKLPLGEAIPRCKLCGAEQSFFFQVAIPEGNPWFALSVAVFACTSCMHDNHLIPEMLPGPLQDVLIPDGFLERYQVNFRFLVFATSDAVVCEHYEEKVDFKRLSLDPCDDPNVDGNKIGGHPNWLLDAEAPKSYGGTTPMHFLLQLAEDFKFGIIENATRQVHLGRDGVPYPSRHQYYELFIGNKIFLFGTSDRSKPSVYAITQVD